MDNKPRGLALEDFIKSQEEALKLIRNIGIKNININDIGTLKVILEEIIEIAKLGLDCNDEFTHVHKYLKWLDDSGYKLVLKNKDDK